jgi:hypothetical protein
MLVLGEVRMASNSRFGGPVMVIISNIFFEFSFNFLWNTQLGLCMKLHKSKRSRRHLVEGKGQICL